MKTGQKWRETLPEKIQFMHTTPLNLIENRPVAQPLRKAVSFYCAAPHAQSVQLAGDFNQWQPQSMQPSVDGWWFAMIHLNPGYHQYLYLIDGKPALDPHATGVARNEQNEAVSWVTVT